MLAESFKNLPIVGPVFHQLRWEFHEVWGSAIETVKSAVFGFGNKEVRAVAKFVEQSLEVFSDEECWFRGGGRFLVEC